VGSTGTCNMEKCFRMQARIELHFWHYLLQTCA